MSLKIARVFPRRTSATPDDDMAFTDIPGLFPPQCDEVHISVAFTWDIPRAEYLQSQWKHVAPVKMGGPAFGLRSGKFEPGMYLKRGYTITSRGCPNKCWFCSVWKREPRLIELPVIDGNNILDDNLLACSRSHIISVFDMLRKNKPCEFTGGLEAKLLLPWHCEYLATLKPKQIFFAYDTPDDYEPLVEAGKLLKQYKINSNSLRCHVLMGYKGDTIEAAEKRLWQTVDAGFIPSAMVYRDANGHKPKEWSQFQRSWQRPAAIKNQIKNRSNRPI